jgi:hypothetical protein
VCLLKNKVNRFPTHQKEPAVFTKPLNHYDSSEALHEESDQSVAPTGFTNVSCLRGGGKAAETALKVVAQHVIGPLKSSLMQMPRRRLGKSFRPNL